MEAIFGNNEFELDKRITFSYGAIGLLALLSNMALCTVLLRNRQMLQRAYNLIIFALAIVDTLTGKFREAQVCGDIVILLQFKLFVFSFVTAELSYQKKERRTFCLNSLYKLYSFHTVKGHS